MRRHELTEEQWLKVQKVLKVRRGPKSSRGDLNFVNTILWRLKTGAPWRDIPERFGPYQTIYNRFARWAQRGWWDQMFKAVQTVDDNDQASLLDATIVRAHQDAAGGRGGVDRNAIGRSAGGFSSKVHLLTTSAGLPVHAIVTAGQRQEATQAEALVAEAHGKAVVADAGYDADATRDSIRARGMKPVIKGSRRRTKNKRRVNRALYSIRYRVECTFHSLKRFRAVACRFEKTLTNYLAVVHIACIFLWIK